MLSVTQNAALWTAPELAVQAINATIAGSANAFAQRHHFAFLQPGQTPDGHTWLLQLGGELPVLRRPDGVTWSIDFRSGDARRRANERNAM